MVNIMGVLDSHQSSFSRFSGYIRYKWISLIIIDGLCSSLSETLLSIFAKRCQKKKLTNDFHSVNYNNRFGVVVPVGV